MSKVKEMYKDLKSAVQLTKELDELKEINLKQIQIIEQLGKELAIRETKLKQVEHLLVGHREAVVIEVSAEEEICEMQINRIRAAARERDLTLEEAKKLDLLIKNKRLSQDQSTITVEARRVPDLPEATLLQIAGHKDESERS